MSIWVLESPVTQVEGEAIAYSIEYLGATAVSSPTLVVYMNGTDVTTAVCISGDSNTASGTTVTMKKITAKSGDGGHRYIAVVSATVDGNTEIRKLEIYVMPASEEQS